MVHFGDAASSTETTVRLGSSSYTGRVPIPQAKPENSFCNVSRRWPSYWSLVRGRTSSIHSELIPTTAKQQLPFLELTYIRVPIAVSFANEMRLDLIQPNHKSVPFFTSFLGTPDLIMIEAHSPTLLSHLYPTTKGVSGLVITFRILTTKTRITNH